MLYEDAEGDAITHPDVLDALEADVAAADAVVWVGLSFEQPATTAYFRRARAAIAAAGRTDATLIALVNPCDDALFNLVSAVANAGALTDALMDVRAAADAVLPALAERVAGVVVERGAGTSVSERAAAAVATTTGAASLFPPAVTNYGVEDGDAGAADGGEAEVKPPTLTAESAEEEEERMPPPPPPPPPPPFTLTASPGE